MTSHSGPPGKSSHSQRIPALRVRLPDGSTQRFSTPFEIGRGEDCAVRLEHGPVSRRHVGVSFDDGRWRVRDLGSSNGTFVDGERIESAAVDDRLGLTLGPDGPVLALEVEALPETRPRAVTTPQPAAGETLLLDGYAARYFGADDHEPVGDRTMMIRRAFRKVQARQQRKYGGIVALVAIAALAAAGYAYYAHRQIGAQRALAEELFYAMKTLDVDIAEVERLIAASGRPGGEEQVRRYRDRRTEMAGNYERFLSGVRLYDRQLTEQERAILRVTRIFGECDIAAPPQYLGEVMNYVRRWQSTGRFTRAVQLAAQSGYTVPIAREFLRHNLPPQFFYLAMQESDFEPYRSGPPTYKGIAKGMWQFIPETGEKYGLRTGPLAALRRPDPADDRHNWQKSTAAAARYIKDIYATDAQASGLLVMASYNWGENRVINLLRRMPANPRERNFWKLLEQHRDQIPAETYDYVFYVVSAAAIGENPRLFGFTYDSPLKFLEK